MSQSRRQTRRKGSEGEVGLSPTFREDLQARIWRAVRLGDSSAAEHSRTELRSEILAAYEQVLETHMTPLNRISVLPFSKELIREAIRCELAENPDHELRDRLELAFVQLESFVSCDEFELVEDFKTLSCAAQKMARSGKPADILESWSQVREIPGDKAVEVLENISERMRRRREEVQAIGPRSSAR